jgi:DNA-dependent RNA polymerase auxiliary subunit epsilon
LKALDTEFAEHIILNTPEGVTYDKKYYIQIKNDEAGKDNKTEDELEAESLRCRDALNELGYNVEYITHITTSEQYDENKQATYNEEYIQKIQEEIERIKQPGKVPTPLETTSIIIYDTIVE